MRTLSVTYQNQLSEYIGGEALTAFVEDSIEGLGILYKNRLPPPEEFTKTLSEFVARAPRLNVLPLISLDGRTNSEHHDYWALDIMSQGSFNYYREMGQFERRLLINTLDVDLSQDDLSSDVYVTDSEFAPVQRLLNIDVESGTKADPLRIMQVFNTKDDHLFVYSSEHYRLYVLKVDFEPDLKNLLTMSELMRNNVMCTVENFDYSPSSKYVLVHQLLYHVS